jgi:methionyl-tRNA formyltransferase
LSFVFFGTPNFSRLVLETLIKNGLTPNLVVTSPDKPVGRKQILTPSPVKQFALENNLKIITPKTKEELLKELQKNNNLTIGILAAYGLILPPEVINVFPKGIINIHPSLLPKYRGSSPIQSAILNGDAETGVTIIKLNEKIDQGEILAQEKVQILSEDTTISLGEKLFTLGTNLLFKILPKYLNNKIELMPQNQSHYHILKHDSDTTKKFTKQDGFISFNDLKNAINPTFCHSDENQNPSLSTLIDRKFRAFQPWPGIWTTLQNGKRMLITKCHLENEVLKIDLVKVEGKQEEKFIKF